VNGAPISQGLYNPRFEHDACGIGAIVNISGKREHAIIDHGKQVLLNLRHRGAGSLWPGAAGLARAADG